MTEEQWETKLGRESWSHITEDLTVLDEEVWGLLDKQLEAPEGFGMGVRPRRQSCFGEVGVAGVCRMDQVERELGSRYQTWSNEGLNYCSDGSRK